MAYYGDQQRPVVQPPPVIPVSVPHQTNTNNVVPESKVFMAIQIGEYMARGLSVIFALIASSVMGSARQTIDVIYTVKFSNFSGLEYFVAANAIVIFLSISSLTLSILFKSKYLVLKSVIPVVDLIALSLLLTANGAASALIAQFDDVDDIFSNFTATTACKTYNHFCSKLKASIVFSFFAVFVYLLLVGLSLVYKKNK
ncbi:hypothetical protein LUZ60_011217 [Juncus effusus]|nr:hypothetical protein LUZ60_011217 [Juncus effusus]